MVVVSNTSPIVSLARIGQLQLLERLYAQIILPDAVRDEVMAGGAASNAGSLEVQTGSWFVLYPVDSNRLTQFRHLHRGLGAGEGSAIIAAIDLSADLILLDDMPARRAAERHALAPIGVLGILLTAKSRGFIALVKPLVDELRSRAGFYVSDATYREIMQRAGE